MGINRLIAVSCVRPLALLLGLGEARVHPVLVVGRPLFLLDVEGR